MGIGTFKGGVHPYDGKELAKNEPIVELKPTGEMVFPVSQHIGAPATPVVSVGDSVLRGQKIAEAGGFVSAPVFSSVSGTVKAIEPRRVATGDMVMSIVIESDGNFIETGYNEVDDVSKLSRDEIIGRIKDAGIVGLGGAGFPTHVKLSPKDPDKIDYIIVNCAECEPYLTSDYRRMVENPEMVVAGLEIMVSMFPNATGVFGVEDNKPDCIAKFNELIKDKPRLKVQPLLTKYPQGGERQLIHAVTGRDLNSKMLPADVGCIVDNVETVCSIYMAVKQGKPLMHQIFTVTGDMAKKPCNYLIYLGTSYKEILEAAGGVKGDVAKYVSGGPMMGFALFDLDVPTTKTASAILCMSKDEASMYETTACINCGRCVEACPENLIPSRLADYAEHGQDEEFEKWYGLECIECGSCSYGCPARRHLAQAIRTKKKTILAAKRAAAAKK